MNHNNATLQLLATLYSWLHLHFPKYNSWLVQEANRGSQTMFIAWINKTDNPL